MEFAITMLVVKCVRMYGSKFINSELNKVDG